MSITRKTIAAAAVSLLAAVGFVQAQDQSNVGAGTNAAQRETNRGVPGVDVDVGKNASGAIDINTNNRANANEAAPARNEMNRGVPGVDVDTGRNASGAVDINTRAPRTDRN